MATRILVDTSVWVQFFRYAHTPEAVHLQDLLQSREVHTCAPIRTEVLSGTRTQAERLHLRELFHAIPMLDVPGDIWEKMEEGRFLLARKGYQASLIDLMIASIAAHHQTPLWSLDEDFHLMAKAFSFPRYFPEK